MSYAGNRTPALWQSFMPRRREIGNVIGAELYSIERYPPFFFDNFDPQREFEKWAAVEVTDFDNIPEELETLLMPGGLYAVFVHYGPASRGPLTYRYIFETWLPDSDYTVDDRLHFAVMGEKYKPEDPHSEEELWIPVKLGE